MDRLRIGIIGTGFASEFHLECLQKVYGLTVEIAGVTSLRAESRNAFGAKHKLPVFIDIASMLDSVDVLDICSPPYAHEDSILQALTAGKHIICEKPLTGYFGPPGADSGYRGDQDSKSRMLEAVLEKLQRIYDAVQVNGIVFGYAENFVYAPSIQKEREIIEKTGAQILRMIGEESHNGSASAVYGMWRYAGGGSLIGKGVHPLGAMLYLKRIEGIARNGAPIRPKSVSSRTHQLTRLAAYRDKKLIRTDYHDIEDYGMMHITFVDGTVADVITSEVVLGGLYDYVEVFANDHRTKCNISPVHAANIYNPKNDQFNDIYLIEKASTKEGWSPWCDEMFSVGYQAEMQDFISCTAAGKEPQSGLGLAIDTTAVTYAAYVSSENRGAETEVPLIG